MGILTWIVLGLIAGALAKFIMPGRDPGGIFVTIIIGILGAVVGGYIGTLLGIGGVNSLDLAGILIATGGSILLLFIFRIARRK